MDEKDDIIEKQIAAAMIDTTTKSYVDDINDNVEHLERRASALESRTNQLYLQGKDLKKAMATHQDLENLRKEIEDEFKDMLTKSMYIVFALFFMVFLIMYFF